MKRKILTLLFVIIAIIAYSQNNVVTISGLVTTPAGAAIPNHEIYISTDSSQFQPMFNYYGQVYTDVNGFYIDTISIDNQGTVYTQGGFKVATFDCMNTYKVQSVSFGQNLPYSMKADFTICDSVIPQSCYASFYTNKDSVNNSTYYFGSNSTGVTNNTQYLWNFGDSTTGAGSYIVHTFPSNGTYYVCLTISGDSCQSTYCNYVTVGTDSLNSGCQAYYYAYSDSSITAPTSYYFVDYSSGNPTNWYWDFGDGTTGTGQYPHHTYAYNGTFNVCLTISGASCQSSYCNYIIVGKDTLNTGCHANFNIVNDSVNSNTNLTQFVDISTGNPKSWFWDFGDGTSSTLQNPTHILTIGKQYNVCLTIYCDSCQSTYCQDFAIDTIITSQCQAYFYIYSDTLNGTSNSTYTAIDGSSGNPISWNWSFGDGTSSNVQNPMHTFSPGTYYVCLAITTASGCSSTYCDYVTVYSQDSTMCNLYVSTSVSNETYPGADNGIATVNNVYGGTPPYLYNWSNGAMTQSISGLTQGYYNVSVTDSKGCFTMATVDVLDASDSINWNNVDTLNTNPIDTCLTFPISNASIYSFTILNSNTVAITWIIYNAQGTNYSFISVQYTFGSYGNYQVPLVISCDSSKGTVYNFYAPLHISTATGIIEAKPSSVSLNVFPNPVTDNLNISIDKPLSGTATISILNLMGQVIQTTNVANETSEKVITLNTSYLPKGLYFVQLNCNGQIETGKFAK